MLNLIFTPAKKSILEIIDRVFDLGPDFTDKIFLEEIRDLARQLNERADREERRLKGNENV